MTTLVATSNMGLQLRGNLSNAKKKIVEKAGDILNLSFNKRRLSLLVSASFHESVEKIKGRKENIVHILEAPLTSSKLANDASLLEDGLVYRQIFVIKSYEIGPDGTITMETLMNFLKETTVNQFSNTGICGDDSGATREMDLRKLIWVVARMQVQVQRYRKWRDEIEVDTWFCAAGKNGIRRDWIIKDHYTKEIIARATSTWVLMNRETRRLSRIPEEVRQELDPFLFNGLAIANEETDCKKIHKLTDDTVERIQSGIVPGWNDMDVNQHVNNVKYIRWILESVQKEVLQDYNMTSMTLEFRRECMESDLLESMTSPSSREISASNNNSIDKKSNLQYIHLLRLQDNKAELVGARTEWHLKQKHK